MRRRLSALAVPLIVGFIVATALFMSRDRLVRPLFRHAAGDRRPPKPVTDGKYSALGNSC
ncbi:hypothetical protein TGAMA5MH_10094 [Trichoderma gamsii]|uniref:Uncharacterized protein n=1 Tax=Trichoderma gamsii TaxID=398673 RepID=A0A2K0SXI9_9HYPO|nr:hypothetical protein TGAMA5MH_10094 [Trichoderma gamsii]